VALQAALAVAGVFVLIACALLFTGKWRGLAEGLGVLGLVTIMAVLVLVVVQTNQVRQNESVVVTRGRYSVGTEKLALAGLIVIPAVVLVGALAVMASQRRLLRSRVPRQLKVGRKHFIEKEYDAALGEYNRAIQFAPHLAEAYRGRACVHHAMGNTAQALADLAQAVHCDPRLVSAYLERAKICTESGDLEGALADFGQAMVLRPNDPELYLNRGLCLLKKGLVKDAVDDFRRVIKLTNHTDFAEPAKNYLRQYEAQAEPPQPATAGSGASAAATSLPQPRSTSLPQPRSEDYVL
jgi:tetratricopeptide (TPR) repeat protein